MSNIRKFRKGDKLESNKGFIHEVLGNETDGGKVRTKLIQQPEGKDGWKYSELPETRNADALRRSWTIVEEGKAPRPNNRITKINAVDVRLGETVRDGDEVFEVKKKVGRRGVWTITDTDGKFHTLLGTDEVEVLGKRGRPLPPTVHYNAYSDAGTVTYQRTTINPGLGHFACGIVSNIQAFASDLELVTCTQACAHRAREDYQRRGGKNKSE
jgi:hypothetical protein